MKKIFFTLPLLIVMTFVMSCGMANDSSNHGISIVYPQGCKLIYADQTADSVVFNTFDSYTTTSYMSPWLDVLDSKNYPSAQKLNNLYNTYYQQRVNLKALPNSSDTCRFGFVQVRSYGEDFDQTVTAVYYQYNWHNVLHPAPSYTYKNNMEVACKFEATDSAAQVVDTLRFVAYSDWTLEQPVGGFVTSPSTSGKAGKQTILLSVEPNTAGVERSAKFVLKSDNGAKTEIVYKQKSK